MRPCLRVNAGKAIFSDAIFHTFGPRLPMSSSLFSAGDHYVCDKFGAGSDTLLVSIQSISSTANDCRKIHNAKAEGVLARTLMPQIKPIMVWSLRLSHCRSEVFDPISLQYRLTEQTHVVNLPRTISIIFGLVDTQCRRL